MADEKEKKKKKKKKKQRNDRAFHRSIRFRIMILLFVMGIVPSVVVEMVIVRSYESRAVEQRTAIVRSQMEILANQLVTRDYISSPDDDVINGEFDVITSIYGGRILVMNRDGRIITDTFDMDVGKYSLSQEVIDCLNGNETSNYDRENQYIEMTMLISGTDEDSASSGILGVLLISVSTSEIRASRMVLEQRGTFILAVIIMLILIFGFVFSGILVKPLQKITDAIEGIADGYDDQNISVTDYRETALITDAFNSMLARVRRVDDSREEFVSNVSHELKTPLASMKVLADSLNMDPNASVGMYREFMQDISSEIDRENQIISDLLSLVRMDKKAESLNIENVSINEELENIVKRLRPLADKADVELILDSFRPVTADVDDTKLTLAFTNIIENAIKYNKPEGGWVRISLNADRKYFYTTISDSGIGIPKESLDKIFDRFYRVDKSHSREIGGTGLGLAIAKSAVTMHKGAIRVTSRVGEGTTFAIRIPLVYTV